MDNELYHYGILGMKWGIRRYQNKDGTLTSAGKKRYGISDNKKSTNDPVDLSTEARLKRAKEQDLWDMEFIERADNLAMEKWPKSGIDDILDDRHKDKLLTLYKDYLEKEEKLNSTTKEFSDKTSNLIRKGAEKCATNPEAKKTIRDRIDSSDDWYKGKMPTADRYYDHARWKLAQFIESEAFHNRRYGIQEFREIENEFDKFVSNKDIDKLSQILDPGEFLNPSGIYDQLTRSEVDAVYPYNEYLRTHGIVFKHSDQSSNELYHYGVLGQKWGVRRYQNEDGTLTEAGKEHYQKSASKVARKFEKADKNKARAAKANEQKYKYYARMNPVVQQLVPRFSLNYRLARYQEAKERKNVSNEHQNQKRGKELLDQLINEYGKDYVSSMNPEIIKLGEKALITYVSYYNATLGDNWKSLDKIKLIGGSK